MKFILTGSLILGLLTCFGAWAVDQHDHTQGMNHEAMQSMSMPAGNAVQMTEGIVEKVVQKEGKITLRHGEIASAKMPAMTMSYRVKQAKWLESIHVGDKVRFAIDKQNDEYVVTQITPVK